MRLGESEKTVGAALKLVCIFSFVVVVVIGLSRIVYDLFGGAVYEKMLEKLRIPFSFEQVQLFGIISVLILLISYLLREKYFMQIL